LAADLQDDPLKAVNPPPEKELAPLSVERRRVSDVLDGEIMLLENSPRGSRRTWLALGHLPLEPGIPISRDRLGCKLLALLVVGPEYGVARLAEVARDIEDSCSHGGHI